MEIEYTPLDGPAVTVYLDSLLWQAKFLRK